MTTGVEKAFHEASNKILAGTARIEQVAFAKPSLRDNNIMLAEAVAQFKYPSTDKEVSFHVDEIAAPLKQNGLSNSSGFGIV